MTAAGQEKSASPISSPRPLAHPFHPLSRSLAPRLSGCRPRLLAPRQNGARGRPGRGEGGREGGGEDGPEPAAFVPAAPSFPRPLRAGRRRGPGSRGAAGLLGLIPALARGACPPAPGGPPAGPEAPRRSRGPEPGRACRSAGPCGGPRGAGGSRRGGRFCVFGFVLVLVSFPTFGAERGSRPPPCGVAPKAASRGGGGGRRALRWRWAWPVARAGGAVARRPPSSLAAGGAPWGGRARRRGAGEPGRMEPRPRPPRPQTLRAQGRRRRLGHLCQAENSAMRPGSSLRGPLPATPVSCRLLSLDLGPTA